jgi:hypothetical protein
LAEQAVKNLVFIAMVFHKNKELDAYEPKKVEEESEEDENEIEKEEESAPVMKSNLLWLFKKVSFLSRKQTPKQVNNILFIW